MALPFGQTLFPTRPELIETFDAKDIANGTGYELFYGAKGDNGEYLATPILLYSEEISSFLRDESIPIALTQKFDLDFDILFNTTRTVKGKIFANIPIGMASNISVNRDMEYSEICKAYHVAADTTETLLATGTSRTVDAPNLNLGGTSFNSIMAVCIMDVSTAKLFKIGETLRITVEGWFKSNEAGAEQAHVMIGHDPQNREFKSGLRGGDVSGEIELANEVRNGGTVTFQETQMTFQVPFKIVI